MMKYWLFAVLILNSVLLFAEEPLSSRMACQPHEPFECPTPWFTGPLLTPSGHIVPGGYVNIEPYVFYTVETGVYDSDWNFVSLPNFTTANFQTFIYIGITSWSDILIIPQASWNSTQGVSSLEFNDFIAEWDVQIMEDTKFNKLPGIKLYIQETFPTGHYQNRDPDKLTTDIGGDGTFVTNLGFVITRLFKLWDCQWLNARFNGFFSFSSPVKVKGFNAYGGAPDTDAKVKPGYSYGGLLGLEYTLTREWVLALDVEGVYQKQTTFKGFPGTAPDGTAAVLGLPKSIQFSLAPAIEYNFNESVGIIAGSWFTVAGKGTPSFISGVIAINYFGPNPKGSKHKYRSSGGGAGGR